MERELREQMAAWRKLHPKASLDAIETELDRQIALLRVAVLGETIATSKAVAGEADAVCPECGAQLERSGRRKRKLQTYGGVELKLEREYLRCPRCGRGFFPSGPGA